VGIDGTHHTKHLDKEIADMTDFILTYSEPILVLILMTILFAFAGITTYNVIDYFLKKKEDEDEKEKDHI
jgi:hypothetical protein